MANKKLWTAEEDRILVDFYHLTNEALAEKLMVSPTTLRQRYAQLDIDRPSGKNELSKARNKIYRELQRGVAPIEWFELPLTRSDARALGQTFYWDGQPCERSGHISRRKSSSGGCIDCEEGDYKKRVKEDEDFRKKEQDARKRRYLENREEYLQKQRNDKNNEKFREWARAYQKKKRQEDIEWRLAKSLRDRFYKALTRGSKTDSVLTLIGCTMDFFRRHLESKFTEGMSWENYGEWHIDHIRPCISFDLTDITQQAECFHYSNLRPLWGDENRSKGGIWEGFDPRTKLRA